MLRCAHPVYDTGPTLEAVTLDIVEFSCVPLLSDAAEAQMQGGPDVTVAFDVGYRPGLADERVVVAIVDLAANLNDVGIACADGLGSEQPIWSARNVVIRVSSSRRKSPKLVGFPSSLLSIRRQGPCPYPLIHSHYYPVPHILRKAVWSFLSADWELAGRLIERFGNEEEGLS